MKLTYVTRQYPELSETFVTEELRMLSELGHEAQVFAPNPGNADLDGAPPARYLEDPGRGERARDLAALFAARPVAAPRAIADRSIRFGLGAADMAAMSPFAEAARRSDHIHAHFASEPAALALQLSALSGTEFSFVAHAYDIYTHWDAVDLKLARCKFAVTVCEYNRRYISERVPDHADKLSVLRCGVDTERFRRATPYDPSGPLLAIGRLVPQKGFEYLVRAAGAAKQSIPPVWIVGDGPEREFLERLIAEHQAPVQLLGARTHAQIRELYEDASALAMPSVIAPSGSRDAMPIVVKEAMAMELPVIGTNEVGIPEEVEPDRGILVEPGSDDALASGLADLYSLPEAARADLGRTGRAWAEQNVDLRRQTERLVERFRAAAS